MQSSFENPDAQFFKQHPGRKIRIRLASLGEETAAFASLGPHSSDRRRMIVARVPDGPHRGMLMPIPLLAFSDEEIADRDEVLLPILRELMLGAVLASDRGHTE